MKTRTKEELNHIKSAWRFKDGELVWNRPTKSGKQIGDKVGVVKLKNGHLNCFLSFNGKLIGYSVGQVAWFLYYAEWPDMEVDHIDCNPENNLKDNLRLATRSQQNTNRIAGIKNRPNKCVYKRNFGGKDRWQVQMWLAKKSKHLGYFDTQEEASEFAELAILMTHSNFANIQSYTVI